MNTQQLQLLQALSGPIMIAPGTGAMIEHMLASAEKIDRTVAVYDDEVMRELLFEEGRPYQAYGDNYYQYPVMHGSTLIIPIEGVLMRSDSYRTPGTNTIAAWYQQAEADESVEQIVEYMNSPGGSVFGIQELADAKMACTKPIETIVFGHCTSAAAWIALASDSIKATSKNCIFGSFGTKSTFQSMAGYYEKEGIVSKDVYSATSPKKDNAHREAEKGNFKPMEQGILKEVDANFMDFVRSRRVVSAETLEGDIFLTEKAIAENLCDGYTTLNQIIKINNNEMESKLGKFFSAMGAKLNGEATEDEVNAAATALTIENEGLQASLDTEKTATAAAGQRVISLEAELKQVKADAEAEKVALNAQIRKQDVPPVLPSDPTPETPDPLATGKPVKLDWLSAQTKADLEAYED